MPLVPDHVASLRQPAPVEDEPDIVIDTGAEAPADNDNDGEDKKIRDASGNVIKIEHADGSVTVSIDGEPLEKSVDASKPPKWFGNLIDHLPSGEAQSITEELLTRIRDDIQSRQEWIDNRAAGMRLLGTKIELPQGQATADSGVAVDGMNTVRHPLLLESVLRFQANASGEMLATDGPVKIHNAGTGETLSADQMANDLETDMNFYLTSTATEYYPDTDRMYLLLGFGGTSFKKVYFCPLRNRPVSESVDASDLIVNQNATDIANARRITHRSMMKPSTIKRLQILKVYKKVELTDALEPSLDAVQLEKKAQDGSSQGSPAHDDRDREIYEVYCELNIKGFEHKFEGKETGLEIPYRVTIDVSSRQMLAITRNYNEDTQDLPVARQVFVKFEFVPGFGEFYGIGLLNIAGNTTNALTAGWRELLDAGMFSNFPGFLYADTGARQNTNIFRVPPGGGAPIKTGGMPIGQAVMNLPYKEPSMALMQLIKDMAETGQRVSGTAELQVAEGHQEAPVGTTLAMIEQAQKLLNSVHKRVYRAHALEYQLLIDLFREHPEAFWQRNRKPARAWDQETFRRALDNYNLVPKADPNTASYLQRALKVMGIKQLQTSSPNLYDPLKVDRAVIRTMGWSNPDEFFASKDAQGQPPPELLQAQAKMQTAKQDADSRGKVADAKVAEVNAKIQSGAYAPPEQQNQGLGAADVMKAKAALMDAETRRQEIPFRQQEMEVKHRDMASEDQNRDQDRSSRERVAVLGLAKELILHHGQSQQAAEEQRREHEHEHTQNQLDRRHEHQQGAAEREHEAGESDEEQAHERQMQREAPKPKPAAGGKKKK